MKSVSNRNNKEKDRRKRDRRASVIGIAKSGGCSVCGYDKCLDALEFHHLDGNDKVAAISDIATIGKLMRELDKCIVVCANCHREVHAGLIDSLCYAPPVLLYKDQGKLF